MNESASKSDWVKAEAMIMCFRKSLDPTFPLLPVVFPDADINVTFLKTYEPFSFNEIQKFTIDCSNEESAQEIARRLVDCDQLKDGFNKTFEDCPWVEQIIDILDQIEIRLLCRAAKKIKMDHQMDVSPLELIGYNKKLNLCRAIACLMHHQSASDCLDVFAEIVIRLNEQSKNIFKRATLSKWVENESVEILLSVINDYESSGVIALNTSSQEIAERYVVRTMLERGDKKPRIRLFSVEQPNGDYDKLSLIRKFGLAIQTKINPRVNTCVDYSDFYADLNTFFKKADLIGFCILPCQFADKDILLDLKKYFTRFVFFVLIG